MKILVSDLPTKPHECLFNRYEMSYWGFQVCVCKFSNEACKLKNNEQCPYLDILRCTVGNT